MCDFNILIYMHVFKYAKHVGKRKLMPPNPLMMMASVDCDAYAEV